MQTQAKPTVYIVDDDPIIRDALELLLNTVGYSTETYTSGDGLLKAWSADWSGCVLLDVTMPGISGLKVQQSLQDKNSSLPIIFVTGHGDVRMAVKAMECGAFSFLQKPYHEDELLSRISAALIADQEQLESQKIEKAIRARVATLTPRELEVMGYVVAGVANKVTAIDMDLSQRTIEVHRARVMEKMQASSFAELVRMSMRISGAN